MIELNKKYGCLIVLDQGEEYEKSEYYLKILERYQELKEELNPLLLRLESIQEEIANNHKLQMMVENNSYTKQYSDFENRFRKLSFELMINLEYNEYKDIELKLETHYKCKCRCGKVHFYNEKTLENNPRYCFYPISIADTSCSYSYKAKNSSRKKEQKYKGLENVYLWTKPRAKSSYIGAQRDFLYEQEEWDYSLPSEKYCELYNKNKIKKITQKEEEHRLMVANLPRINVKNFDEHYVGKQYESLYIAECVNDHLESEPMPYYTQMAYKGKRKHWSSIQVYKQYRCKCVLCGREQLITCDKFGIYPPTQYGYNAYNGYWSDVKCDCHHISSFQWIVNKLLFENDIKYSVEVSFSDLYGVGETNLLRFDFAIYNEDGSIKCLVECQGEQHFKSIDEYGGEEALKKQQANDELKREYVKKHNIPYIEISYKDKKYEKIEGILHSYDIL